MLGSSLRMKKVPPLGGQSTSFTYDSTLLCLHPLHMDMKIGLTFGFKLFLPFLHM